LGRNLSFRHFRGVDLVLGLGLFSHRYNKRTKEIRTRKKSIIIKASSLYPISIRGGAIIGVFMIWALKEALWGI
jgi:hypothetical protein